MSRLFLITIIFFIGSCLKAQSKLDSLYAVWQDVTQADTTRLKALETFTWDGYMFSQPDSAFYIAQQGYEFAQAKGLKKYMASALNTQGASFYLSSNYPQAIVYYQKSLAMQEGLGNKKGIASAMGNIGVVYYEQGNYPQALEYHLNNLALSEELVDKIGIASSLGNMGLVYKEQGNYPQAQEYYQKSLAMQEELGNKNGIANSLDNIGMVYYEQGSYPKALEYHQKSLAMQEELGDNMGIANSLSNIGMVYYEQGNYPKALEYHQKSLAMQEELGNKNGISNSLSNIGVVYYEQGNYPQAQEYCKNGLKLAVSIGALGPQISTCQCLYDTFKAMGKGNEALMYLEKMRVVEGSLQIEETNKKLQQMEFAKQMLTDSIAKAEEARLVEEAHEEELRQKEQTRNWLMGAGLIAVLLAGGFYSRLRYVRKSKASLQLEKDRSENLLLNILPADIAAELKEKGRADARDFEMVSILFTDFKGFTAASAKLSAQELVTEINTCFEAFDGIVGKYGIEKIKTIGDAYMAAGGLPVPTDDSVRNTVLTAIEMQNFILQRKATLDAERKPGFEMRVGVHTGPVVAGIVGVKKFQYDIWGDTVNTASRMESSGEVSKVNISQATYELLKNDPHFAFESRGKIEAKGKGEIEMYYVSLI